MILSESEEVSNSTDSYIQTDRNLLIIMLKIISNFSNRHLPWPFFITLVLAPAQIYLLKYQDFVSRIDMKMF